MCIGWLPCKFSLFYHAKNCMSPILGIICDSCKFGDVPIEFKSLKNTFTELSSHESGP